MANDSKSLAEILRIPGKLLLPSTAIDLWLILLIIALALGFEAACSSPESFFSDANDISSCFEQGLEWNYESGECISPE